MAFWLDIAAFLVKAVIIVAAFGGLAVLIARLARSSEPKDQEIKVRSLDERYDDMRDAMNGELLDRKERKALAKALKKEAKATAKTSRGQEPGKRIFVLTFKGDIRASAVKVRGIIQPGGDQKMPFTGELLNEHGKGVFRCICCDTALYSSETKFESGTGWPSFWAPIAKENIVQLEDSSFGMDRTAVSCRRCEAHLGHVFDDGPKPTGLRYCMNSVSLRFAKAS